MIEIVHALYLFFFMSASVSLYNTFIIYYAGDKVNLRKVNINDIIL